MWRLSTWGTLVRTCFPQGNVASLRSASPAGGAYKEKTRRAVPFLLLACCRQINLPHLPAGECCLAPLGEPCEGAYKEKSQLFKLVLLLLVNAQASLAVTAKNKPGILCRAFFFGWKMGFEPTTSSATN